MEQFKRVFVVVLDSLGAGAMPDAADYGDAGVDTLGHTRSRWPAWTTARTMAKSYRTQ